MHPVPSPLLLKCRASKQGYRKERGSPFDSHIQFWQLKYREKRREGRAGLPGKVLEAEDNWQLTTLGISGASGDIELQAGLHTHVGIGYGLQTNAKQTSNGYKVLMNNAKDICLERS